MGGFLALRTVAQGASSILWPLENEFDSALMYMDGNVW